MTQTRTHYLIDFENVHEEGLSGSETLGGNDYVHLFSTRNAPKISIQKLTSFNAVNLYSHAIPAGKQSLDMHLVSYLGYLIGMDGGKDSHYIIVSKDTDYDNVIAFWKGEGVGYISRQDTIVPEPKKKSRLSFKNIIKPGAAKKQSQADASKKQSQADTAKHQTPNDASKHQTQAEAFKRQSPTDVNLKRSQSDTTQRRSQTDTAGHQAQADAGKRHIQAGGKRYTKSDANGVVNRTHVSATAQNQGSETSSPSSPANKDVSATVSGAVRIPQLKCQFNSRVQRALSAAGFNQATISKVASTAAKHFGEEPKEHLRDDLNSFDNAQTIYDVISPILTEYKR